MNRTVLVKLCLALSSLSLPRVPLHWHPMPFIAVAPSLRHHFFDSHLLILLLTSTRPLWSRANTVPSPPFLPRVCASFDDQAALSVVRRRPGRNPGPREERQRGETQRKPLLVPYYCPCFSGWPPSLQTLTPAHSGAERIPWPRAMRLSCSQANPIRSSLSSSLSLFRPEAVLFFGRRLVFPMPRSFPPFFLVAGTRAGAACNEPTFLSAGDCRRSTRCTRDGFASPLGLRLPSSSAVFLF